MSGRPGPPHTPDGRYFVMVGKAGPRLWRATRPGLNPEERARLVAELMSARRAVREAAGKSERVAEARARVDVAKRALGERGPVWWDGGAPDFNRRLVAASPYEEWWGEVSAPIAEPAEADEKKG